MMTDDMILLRDYVERNSETAFATLVSRHVNLVYSVALRQVNDPHLAEEITQAVFTLLARKAKSLGSGTILSSWLCRAARYISANALTLQGRRQRREQEAFMQSLSNESEPSSTWTQIAPLLDAAMEQLGEKEHSAVVLRFFEGRTFREVGDAVGASEDAAKMRVARALEKLRKFFARRGIASTAGIVSLAISAHAVQSAPADLAKAATASALSAAAAAGPTLTLIKGALKLMAWTKMKTAVVSIAVLAGMTTTTVIIQHRMASHAPKQAAAPSVFLDEAWFVNAGYDSPHATMKTMLWAMNNGNTDAFLECLTPEGKAMQQKRWVGKSRDMLVAEAQQQINQVRGSQIVGETTIDENQVVVSIMNAGRTNRMMFKRIGNDWKMARS